MPDLSVTSGTGLTLMQNADAGLTFLQHSGIPASQTLAVWACRMYPLPLPCQKYRRAGSIPFHRQQYERARCTPFINSNVNLKGVSYYIAWSVDRQGVCITFHLCNGFLKSRAFKMPECRTVWHSFSGVLEKTNKLMPEPVRLRNKQKY